jgi:hypothetical protein
MTISNDFYQELGRVPDLPPRLYGTIRRRIRRASLLPRTIMALAAALILAIGAIGLWHTPKGTDAVALSPDVAEELQSINEYCNGKSIKQDLEAYAFYEGEIASY